MRSPSDSAAISSSMAMFISSPMMIAKPERRRDRRRDHPRSRNAPRRREAATGATVRRRMARWQSHPWQRSPRDRDAMTIKDQTAIVGVGSTPYYRRGRSVPQTPMELAGKAVLAALDDAGLTADDLDGFALYSMGFDTSLFAQWLGVPEVRFTALLTGGGGGAAGSVGLAAAAIATGMAECVVSRDDAAAGGPAGSARRSRRGGAARARPYSAPPSPEGNFIQPSGLMGPGQMFAVLAQRHMHLYGTKREHFAEVAISTRDNAIRRDRRRSCRTPLTLDEYFGARMISDPLCLYDFCLECDGAVAVVTTSVERARDLRHPPAYVMASAHGGAGAGGRRSPGWACPTSTSRRRVTGRSRSGSTTWRASGPTTSTSRCSTTTSRRW